VADFKAYVQRYIHARRRGIDSMRELQREIDDWLELNEAQEPALVDIARLEALHARRESIARELKHSEDGFLEYLMQLRSESKV
jgi:hypothetical protein